MCDGWRCRRGIWEKRTEGGQGGNSGLSKYMPKSHLKNIFQHETHPEVLLVHVLAARYISHFIYATGSKNKHFLIAWNMLTKRLYFICRRTIYSDPDFL